jgi:hypothetical protein
MPELSCVALSPSVRVGTGGVRARARACRSLHASTGRPAGSCVHGSNAGELVRRARTGRCGTVNVCMDLVYTYSCSSWALSYSISIWSTRTPVPNGYSRVYGSCSRLRTCSMSSVPTACNVRSSVGASRARQCIIVSNQLPVRSDLAS